MVETAGLYNTKMWRVADRYIFAGTQYYTWDCVLGEGATLDEALASTHVIGNWYDDGFRNSALGLLLSRI